MAFRKGGQGAQQEAEQTGGGFARTEYLKVEDDGQVTLRYLTDSPDWIYVDQHAGAPTKNKPEDFSGNWPKSMPATCRYDEAFKGVHTDCYICDAGLTNTYGKPCKPTIRVWALACLREEVIGTKEMVAKGEIEESQVGKRLGFKDAMREIADRDEKGQETGKTRLERAIVVVNMAPSNYFNGLQSLYGVYGTVCDRDYVVKKSGKGKDTAYNHIPLDPTPNLKPGMERWEKYEKSVKEQNISLEEIISDKASDDYFARFFDPSKTPAPRGGGENTSGGGQAPEAPAAPADEVDADALAAMRARVRGHGSAQPATVGASSDID